MLLLFQTLGVLAAGALIGVLLRPAGDRRLKVATGFSVATVVLSLAISVGPAWRGIRDLASGYWHDRSLTKSQAATAGGAKLGVQVEFLRWVRSRLGPRDRYYVVGFRDRFGNVRVPPSPMQLRFQIAYDWTLFQLSPNIAVGRAKDADVAIFYDMQTGNPALSSRFGPVESFAPGYGVARRRAG